MMHMEYVDMLQLKYLTTIFFKVYIWKRERKGFWALMQYAYFRESPSATKLKAFKQLCRIANLQP